VVTVVESRSAAVGYAAQQVQKLIDELSAADELITELVAENEDLRARLAGLERSGGAW
jgi:cell division septum initiation protein DivIVA